LEFIAIVVLLLAAWLVVKLAGFMIKGLPAVIHLPLALLAGAVVGGLWAGIT